MKRTVFSIPVIFLFLILSGNKIYGNSEESKQLTRTEISEKIGNKNEQVENLIKKNEQSIWRVSLKAQQLLEQGKQVIKPWEHSWQLGVNYFYAHNHGHSSPEYERFFTRSRSSFERNISLLGRNYKYITKGDNPLLAGTNYREDENSYGFINTEIIEEPMVEMDILPGVKLKAIADITIPDTKKIDPIRPISPEGVELHTPTPGIKYIESRYGFDAPQGMIIYDPNSDDSAYIADGYDYYEDIHKGDVKKEYPEASLSQQNIKTPGSTPGSLVFEFLEPDKKGDDAILSFRTNNINFSSVYGPTHTVANPLTPPLYTWTYMGGNYYPMRFTGGHPYTIDNTNIFFTNKNSQLKDEFGYSQNIFSYILGGKYGDTTLIVQRGSSILLNGSQGVGFIQGRSTETPEGQYNTAYINNGNIFINGKYNRFVHTLGDTTKHATIFKNMNYVKVDGYVNSLFSVGYSIPFSFINDGIIQVTGTDNHVISIIPEGQGEIILNWPITITGDNNIAVQFSDMVEDKSDRILDIFATDKKVPQGAYESSDSNVSWSSIIRPGDENGNFRNSKFNIEIKDGEKNKGIYKGKQFKDLRIDNFNISATGGEKNSMILFNNINGSVIGNELAGNINITGGVDNRGIVLTGDKLYKSNKPLNSNLLESVGDKTTINIKNSPESTGIIIKGEETALNGHLDIDSKNANGFQIWNSQVKNKGTMNFKGTEKAYGITALSSYYESTGDTKIEVDGKESVGIYSGIKPERRDKTKSTVKVSNMEITAKNGATALFANKSNIILDQNNVINVDKHSQTMVEKGTIDFKNETIINIAGDPETDERGLGILIPRANTQLITFERLFDACNNFYFNNSLHNVTINLDGGIGVVVDRGKVKLTHTTPQGLASIGGPKINVLNNRSIPFSIQDGQLIIDKPVNLDNPEDDFYKVRLAGSTVNNKSDVTSSRDGENLGFFINRNKEIDHIRLENYGNIEFTGKGATVFHADTTTAHNNGKISIGDNSVALEVINRNMPGYQEIFALNNNNGEISLGKDSVAIHYLAKSADGNENIKTNVENRGKIQSNSENAIGILATLEDNVPVKKLQNKGKIELLGDNSVGILVNGDNTAINPINRGEIVVGDSTDNDSSAGIFNNIENGITTNAGKIKSGKGGFGIHGYGINTTNSSEITVGEHGVGLYSQGSDLSLKGKINLDGKKAIGVYTHASNQNIDAEFSDIDFGGDTVGIYNHGSGNTVNVNSSPVTLNNDDIFIISKDTAGTINNSTDIKSSGDLNYGIYGGGNIKNSGEIDFSQGIGNIGIFSSMNGVASNSGKIIAGTSDLIDNRYSIGMIGGYYDHELERAMHEGTVINERNGVIEVAGDHGIGMYASGRNSKAINYGTIKLMGEDSIGMFLENNAVGENHGTITATADAARGIGAIAMRNAVFKNYGTISIEAPDSTGVMLTEEGRYEEISTSSSTPSITADTKISSFSQSSVGKKVSGVTITNRTEEKAPEIIIENIKQKIVEVDTNRPVPQPEYVEVTTPDVKVDKINLGSDEFKDHNSNSEITKLSMYIDTSGVNYTNPILGMENLPNLRNVDLMIGTEATKYTNSKGIKVKDNIIEPYNKVLKQGAAIKTLGVYAGSLTWIGTAEQDPDDKTLSSLYLAKIPYTKFANPADNLYNFTDGLEKRYGVEDIYSREKQLFNKLNDIGENEQILLAQAFKEMMGYEYSNTYRRIWDSKLTFDREFDTLMKWDTETKDTTKVKFFREDNKFRTTKDGITSYNRDSHGVFVLNNNETVTLGNSEGWFFGASIDRYKFKDLGKSREKSYNGQVGYYKERAWGYNRELNYQVKGGIQGSYRKMDRRYLVADEIFKAKSRYHSIGAFADGKLSSEIRLSEGFKLKPSVGVDLSATKLGRIKEKSGEVRLRAKGRTELAATPKAEIILAHSTDRTDDSRIKTEVGYKIYRKYARDQKLKAKVNYTDADYYSLARDKYGINSEISIGVALEKPDYGVGAKVVRNLRQHYTGFQLDFRIKFDDID